MKAAQSAAALPCPGQRDGLVGGPVDRRRTGRESYPAPALHHVGAEYSGVTDHDIQRAAAGIL